MASEAERSQDLQRGSDGLATCGERVLACAWHKYGCEESPEDRTLRKASGGKVWVLEGSGSLWRAVPRGRTYLNMEFEEGVRQSYTKFPSTPAEMSELC